MKEVERFFENAFTKWKHHEEFYLTSPLEANFFHDFAEAAGQWQMETKFTIEQDAYPFFDSDVLSIRRLHSNVNGYNSEG